MWKIVFLIKNYIHVHAEEEYCIAVLYLVITVKMNRGFDNTL
jgi:hypothetical protein